MKDYWLLKFVKIWKHRSYVFFIVIQNSLWKNPYKYADIEAAFDDFASRNN